MGFVLGASWSDHRWFCCRNPVMKLSIFLSWVFDKELYWLVIVADKSYGVTL